MRKIFASMFALCFAAVICAAQNAPPESVCEVHVNKVKPGMTAQYEQGRAKHMAWHKSQNDTWSWNTYEITTGPETGDYLVSSCGHEWKDFDTREKFNVADAQNAMATMGSALASETMSLYVLRQDLSATPKPAIPPYFSVVFFHLKPDAVNEFRNAAKQVNDAYTKTNTPRHTTYWYTLVSGGSGPEMVLVQERSSIGDLGPTTPKTLDDIMKEAYGDQGATTMTTLRKAIDHTDSELLHYRPDLSYTAPAAK